MENTNSSSSSVGIGIGIGRDGTSTEGMYGLSVVVGPGQVRRVEEQHQQQQDLEVEGGTSTERSLGHNLDGSPSWNSAMSPMISQQLEELYRYQGMGGQGVRQGLPRRPDSSLGRNSSLSMTESSDGSSRTRGGSRQYSLELRRQQEEQLQRLHHQRQQQQQQQQQYVGVEGLYHPHPHPYMEMDMEEGERYRLRMNVGGVVEGVFRPRLGEEEGGGMEEGGGVRGEMGDGGEGGMGTITSTRGGGGHRPGPLVHHAHPSQSQQQRRVQQTYYPPQSVYEVTAVDGAHLHHHHHHLQGQQVHPMGGVVVGHELDMDGYRLVGEMEMVGGFHAQGPNTPLGPPPGSLLVGVGVEGNNDNASNNNNSGGGGHQMRLNLEEQGNGMIKFESVLE